MELNPTHTQITDRRHILDYLTGGHAEFTLQSKQSGKHFTYRITRAKVGFFVNVLAGPDSQHDYQYLAMAPSAMTNIVATKSSPDPKSSKSFQALNWFLVQLRHDNQKNLSKVEFYHTGNCSRCGRKLTTPESIERGIGPVCLNKMN